MTVGLSSTGFESKTLQSILDDIAARLRVTFGSGTDTTTDEVVMLIVNAIAIEVKENWNNSQLLYDFLNPENAEGIPLDNVGAITNTPRIPGAKSTVGVDVLGTEGSAIPINFLRAVQDTGDQFKTTEATVLPAVGLQPLSITMTALNDGETPALAGTLNQGSLPAGVTSMTNPLDAVLGSDDETDEEYRVGRKDRLSAAAAATIIAIKASILSILEPTPVTVATILENDTDDVNESFTPDLPPHSIRAIVSGGSEQAIIDVLGEKKGAGTYTDGTVSGTYTDPIDGQTFPIRFSRVSDTEIHVAVVITSKNSEYPASGDQDIEDAILALDWDIGEDVILPKLQNAVTETAGIIGYTLYFDTTPTPVVDATITIAEAEQAIFDSNRIGVTS